MSKVEDFLTKEEESAIVEAIRVAEKNTSGEIRVFSRTQYGCYRITKRCTHLSCSE